MTKSTNERATSSESENRPAPDAAEPQVEPGLDPRQAQQLKEFLARQRAAMGMT